MQIANKNPIVKRIAIRATCTFASPALIGSGYGEHTDNDILRDHFGMPFVPGSTVAGVLRCLCPGTEALFGEAVSSAEGNVLSPLWVYDAQPKNASIIQLDGVAIDPIRKVALDEKKYDYEAIASGAVFILRFLLHIRQNDIGEGIGKRYDDMLLHLAGALTSGQTAFGAKTSRGFGRVTCDKVQKREFDFLPGNEKALNDWLDFDWEDERGFRTLEGSTYVTKQETLKVNLQLNGSIMIRDTRNIYDNLPKGMKAPDYKHLSIQGRPMILGTSWAGAFRSWLYKLLIQIQNYPQVKAENYLNDVFGYVADEDKKSSAPSATVSKIIFDVSELLETDKTVDGYRFLKRVKIDRFTGGAADGALFDETPWFGGTTTLEIRYPKERQDIRELILLALEGIDKELLQIGGETSVGRGFFEILSIDGESKDTVLGKRKDALLQVISTWRGGGVHEN